MPVVAQETGRIDRIEVDNFKSYKGRQIIGPFKNFTAIIGPNGAGKSNLMDAISFVLGVRSVHLRGDKLRDLVYSVGDADPEKPHRKASVMLVFLRASGEEVRLMRGITTAGASEYRVNGSVVSWDEYNEQLKSLGILVKARNFLVFQGDVESIASKNPRELTGLFEQISGSEEFRKEYERLAEEKTKAEENTAFSFQKKKNMTAEKKQKKDQKDEAEKHLQLQKEFKEKRAENFLWQLYLNQRETDESKVSMEKAKDQLEKVQSSLRDMEGRSAEQAKKSADSSKEVINEEKKVARKEAEIEKKRPEVVKLREAQKRQQKKVKDMEEELVVKKKQQAEHVKLVASLERQLQDMQAQLDGLDGSTQEDPEARRTQLASDQLEEYREKKTLAGTRTSRLRQDKDALVAKQETDKRAQQQVEDELQQLEQKEKQLQEVLRASEAESERLLKDVVKLEEELKQAKERETAVGDEGRRLRHRAERLREELSAVEQELFDAKADRRESEHEHRMVEAVNNMKRLFPGVHGRLSELCKTTQPKYRLAVSVVMGKLFDAVAVDDERTAKDCIQYLRDQRLAPMTFIPLGTARVKPVQERLRTLGGTAKLVIDILIYPPPTHNAHTSLLLLLLHLPTCSLLLCLPFSLRTRFVGTWCLDPVEAVTVLDSWARSLQGSAVPAVCQACL